ncbi:CD2BP2 [Bugula neritina]|nr:CD2BP2 [Bugula neritina]
MEIYDDTYEKIAYKIQEKEQPIKKVPEKLPENEEDALDMFGDEFDEKVAKSESKNNDEPVLKKRKVEPVATAPSSTDDIQWEYKQTDEESAEICGPFTSSQMQQFVDDNKFPGGVYVRKVGAGSDFYSSKRIDFELYT